MKDKKKIVITLFCVISVLLIAVGVTYSIFTYTKKGDTENTVTSGKLTFLYTENTGTGTGINITNAFPVSDELGKAYSSDSQVFDFKVESEIVGNASIPYEVTVAKTNSSTLSEDYVKIYLTDTTETEEVELLEPTLYSNLPESSTSEDEKQIYYDVVEANEDYEKDFRLRMWVREDSNQEEINEKTFTIKVGVYSNASVVEAPASVKLADTILANNTLVTSSPTLTTTSEETNENGLYSSTDTNSGNPTYYFRGNVENNYVSFAGMTWRIVRINEDGTVRLILSNGINSNATYVFNTTHSSLLNMYYTNSDTAKPTVDSWYQTNLASYSDKIATGDYFCEEAKAKSMNTSMVIGNANMKYYTNYTPDFRCSTDGNGYGLVNSNIGLITYEEMVYAGGYPGKVGDYYLYGDIDCWTMSPGYGYYYSSGSMRGTHFRVWIVGGFSLNSISSIYTSADRGVRPVINLTADVTVTGTGTSTDPYVVQ